jgi:hypothetical protein
MSYARVSILGTTVGGEVWSINPTFDPTGEFPGWTQSTADAATAAINNILPGNGLLNMLSTALTLTGCRLEVRDDATDDLIGLSLAMKTVGDPGTGAPTKGPSNATVISLITETPGGSGRGRIYWPNVGGTVNTSLRQLNPTPATIASEMKTYLKAIETALETAYTLIGFDLAVRSKTTHTTPHVVRLRVGDVIDTQRRRRDSLVESYANLAYP